MSDYTGPVRRAGLAAENRELEEKVKQRRREWIEADTADAPRAVPKETERPSKRAQWDEHRGTWVEWDVDAGEWRVVTSEGG